METGWVQLVEREAQLAALAGYAAEARGGQGRVVLVAGEAGVGKSALVERLQRDLRQAAWYWGACDGLFTPRPLGPLFDIAAKLGGELLARCRDDAPREELFGALLRQVRARGELRVLVVEDIHWADEATIDLLRFLTRRLRDAPVLLIATYRDDGLSAGDPLRLALGDLATQRPLRRIDLPPLSVAGTAQLAAGSGLAAASLHELTGGNPFYLTEVLQAGAAGVPPSARDAVLARAARLTAAARALLETAALLGTQVDLPLLRAVTPAPAGAVDELLAAGLLRGDGPGLRFRHEIARRAVADAVPAHRRVVVHAAVLAALEAAGYADDARLAFHAEGAGDGPAALRYASAAARQSAQLGAHREAAAQYERALRFAAGAPAAEVAALYDGFGYEAALLDRWQEAVDAREQALTGWRAVGERLREGTTLRALAWALCAASRGAEGVDAGRAAVELLEPLGPGPELASAYGGLAALLMVRYQHGEAIRLARLAQQVAAPLGLTGVVADALNTEGCALHGSGREWAGKMREALDTALAGGTDVDVGRAYVNNYAMHVAERLFAEAEPYYDDGMAFCAARDVTSYSIFLRSERTSLLERTGRWDEAVAIAEGLLRWDGPSPNIRLCPLNRLGLLRARRGEPGVWECLDEAISLADATGEPQQIVPVRLSRAEARWLEGSPDAARAEAELADDHAAGCDPWERGAVAVWLRRTGSPRPPRGTAAEPYRRTLDGDWRGAASRWAGLGCPYEAALALLGSCAEEDLREALGLLHGLGAVATAGVARRRMRSLGIRSIPAGPRTATREHPLGLTRREREVLDLICAGCTNAGIAERLFISAKTVDHHVSAVLGKLGAPTRGAAAAEAVRLGLVSALPVKVLPCRRPGPRARTSPGGRPATRCTRTPRCWASWRSRWRPRSRSCSTRRCG